MPEDAGTRREDRIALALLVLLVVLAFANVVFGGKSLVPSENANPLDYRPSEQISGPRFVPAEEWTRRNLASYANYRDTAASTMQMEPAQELLRRSLRRGEFPFWDPYVGAGNPSFASMVPAYLFPPSFLVVLLGNGSLVKNIYILLLIFSSGAFTYFLLRNRGLGWEASLAGGFAFALSGAVVQTAPLALGQPVAMFSLAVLVTARLIDRPDMRRSAEVALTFAFIAFASFPPILLQVFGTCVTYVIVALFLARREQRAPLAGWFVAGAASSLAIAAVVYLPGIAVMSEATQTQEFYKTAAVATLDPRWILQLLSPTVMGGTVVYLNPAVMGVTGLHLYYSGAVPLLLAGVGFLARPGDRARALKIAVILVAALSMAKIFGVPPVQWIIHVPLLRTIHYAAYFGIAVGWAVAILAALGVDSLVSGRARRWHLVASGAVLGLALATLRFFAYRREVHLHGEGWRWIADFRLLVLFAILAFLFAMAIGKRRIAVALVIAVLGIEGSTNSFFPRARRWDIWRHPPRYIEVIEQRTSGGRVLPMPIYPANAQSVFRQPTIDSLAPFVGPRVYEFHKRWFSPRADLFLRGTTRIPPEGVLDVANIEYLAIGAKNATDLLHATRRGYESVYADDLMVLARRRPPPRYSFTSDYRITSKEAALEEIAELPAEVVLLEELPSFPPAAQPRDRATAQPTVVHFSVNEVAIEVTAPRAGLLVCSESNMNGWTATVDDRPARIFDANYAFRAVEVPQGSHVVRFRYRAPGFRAGLAITAIALIAALAGLLVRPRGRAPEP